MEEIILIPENRIGVLIGPKGKVKRTIEVKTKVVIEIDSGTGEVTISGKGEENFFRAADIVKAIGRGFSPERAFELFKEDRLLKIIEIEDLIGENESRQKARRGRVIGKKGIAREMIEKKTGCLVSVKGKTVSIIGSVNTIEDAIDAVEMLLGGVKHVSTTKFLNRRKKARFKL